MQSARADKRGCNDARGHFGRALVDLAAASAIVSP
jgi:hypothetical protein